MAVSKDGTLVMADVAKVKGKKASRFDIRRSAYAGFDDASTYRIHSFGDPGIVLGNSGSAENSAPITGEALSDGNRGQYWNIKTIDMHTFAVGNAFYLQNFDDGGESGTAIVQWPATPGVWRNARFGFESVAGHTGVYRIVSKSKPGKMYTLEGGRLVLVPHDPADTHAWFYILTGPKAKRLIPTIGKTRQCSPKTRSVRWPPTCHTRPKPRCSPTPHTMPLPDRAGQFPLPFTQRHMEIQLCARTVRPPRRVLPPGL